VKEIQEKDKIESKPDKKGSGFEDEKEDAHVTLTAVHNTKKTKGLMKSSSVLSIFTDKLLNFENTSPADIEIASLMDSTVRHEEPSSQTSSLYTIPITELQILRLLEEESKKVEVWLLL
nr:hypothetical protein [Tanacetum cinerariifolium]